MRISELSASSFQHAEIDLRPLIRSGKTPGAELWEKMQFATVYL